MTDRRCGFIPALALMALMALVAWGGVCAGEGSSALGGEVGVLAGALLADEDLSGDSGTVEPTFGLRGGSVFRPRLIWFVDALYASVGTSSALGDARMYWGRTGLEWLFSKKPRSSWFVNGAFGWTLVDYSHGTVEDWHRPLVSAGVGQRYGVGGRKLVRWELRGDVTLDDPGLNGETMSQVLLLGGFVWGPAGGAAAADEDGDGVNNGKDRCPDTPFGAVVDRNGCPQDSDGDGVPDGVDSCPSSPADQPVNEFGCPSDLDGDGIDDGTDACPGTPEGVVVDDWGCPVDRDLDGVPDGLDRCPRTPFGAEADENGCAVDGDGDGVPDGLDRCPDSPADARTDDRGCRDAHFLWVPERQTLILWLNFEPSTVELIPSAEALLDEVAPQLRSTSDRFEVGGHIDPEGRERDFDRLSVRRAEAVRDYLVTLGIEADRLDVRGYGGTVPFDVDGPSEPELRTRVELTRLD